MENKTENKWSVQDVLQDAVNTINNIMLPVAFSDAGSNLKRVANNLQACIVFLGEQSNHVNPTESPSESTEGESVKEEGDEDGREADPE